MRVNWKDLIEQLIDANKAKMETPEEAEARWRADRKRRSAEVKVMHYWFFSWTMKKAPYTVRKSVQGYSHIQDIIWAVSSLLIVHDELIAAVWVIPLSGKIWH